ncbi:hypothetical protein P8936_07405 [Edaphobacter paludis]|uniref:Uncharacterized protein n=1 Tax=Edaphobacter paludis TaxID=3035702 RepID=A0AAU7DBH1_9BACT
MNLPASNKEDRLLDSEGQLVNGPAAAAILSAGIGCFAIGLLAVIGDGSRTMAGLFTFYRPTGPLSGVSSLGIMVWLAVWLGLARFWRTRTVAIGRVNLAAFVFLTLGLLLTFPPFEHLLLR